MPSQLNDVWDFWRSFVTVPLLQNVPLPIFFRSFCTSIGICETHWVSLNGAEHSVKSGNLRNYWSINWIQFKDPLCYLCLCGTVVSTLTLTQGIVASNRAIFLIFDFLLLNSVKTFRENFIRSFEFSHLKPVNEFTEFGEFLLDTDGAIATCGHSFMYYLWKCTVSGTSLSTLVVRITCVRLNILTTGSQHCTCGMWYYFSSHV